MSRPTGRTLRALSVAVVVGLFWSISSGFVTVDVAGAAAVTPTVTGVSPDAAEKHPGWNSEAITITGSGFQDVEAVWFGDKRATAFSKNADGTALRPVTPKNVKPGRYQITLETVDPATKDDGKPVVTKHATGHHVVIVAPIPKLSNASYPDPNAYYYDFDEEEKPVAQLPDWMADRRLVPDSALLSDLSLPGTHDTGAYDTRTVAQTQTMNVPAQLQSGIRALDVRVGEAGSGRCSNGLHLFHGGECYQSLRVELGHVATFLNAHPTELVVMRLGTAGVQSGGDLSETELAEKALEELERVYHFVYWGESDNPAVEDLRGRIFVLSNFDAAGNAMLPGRPYGDVSAQDTYDVFPVANIRKKWDDIRTKFDESNASNAARFAATRDPAKEKIFLNHISAANGAAPCTFASGLWDCKGIPNILDPGGNPKLQTLLTYGYAGTCNISDNCSTMVERGLYQVKLCLPGVETSICSAYYEGLNMMAQAYIVGSKPAGSNVPWRPTSDGRRPAFPGIKKTGIVMTDFPGKSLITAIIGANLGGSVDVRVEPDYETAEQNGWAHNGWFKRPVDVKLVCHGEYETACPTDADGNPVAIETLRKEGINKSKSVTLTGYDGNTIKSPPTWVYIDSKPPSVFVPQSFDVDATTDSGAEMEMRPFMNPSVPWRWLGFEVSVPPGAPPRLITMSDDTSGLEGDSYSDAVPTGVSCELQSEEEPTTLPLGRTDLPVGTTTITCTAKDNAGHVTTRSFSIHVRAKVTATPTSDPNENGWYASKPVVVHFTCTGTGANVCPADQTFDHEGEETSHASVMASDGTQVTSNEVPVNIDTVPPTIDATPITVDATMPNGAFVDVSSAASDATSGVASLTCTPFVAAGVFPVGDRTTSCRAADRAGNVSDPISVTVHVRGPGEQALALAQAVSDAPDLVVRAAQVREAIDQAKIPDACAALGELYTALRRSTGLGGDAATLESRVTTLAGALGGCPFQDGTTTTVSVDPVGARTGQPVTLTAVVAPPANAPNASITGGKVQFIIDNNTPLGNPVAVKKGSTGVATKTVTFGADLWGSTVSAQYLGTAKHAPSSSAKVPLDLTFAETTTSLEVSSSNAPYGAPVTLKAQVSVVSPGTAKVAGDVEFYEGGLTPVKIGSVPVSSKGMAKLPVTLSFGRHDDVFARFVGDALHGSSSNMETIEVVEATTKTQLSVPTTVIGSSVTATVTVKSVSPSKAVPVGTVTLSGASGAVGTADLDAQGKASIVVPNVGAGKLQLTAQYQGSVGFRPSSATKSTKLTVDAATALLRGTGPQIIGDDSRQGASVAMSGDTLVIGAPRWDNPSVFPTNQGSIYVFQRPAGGSWAQATQVARLTLSNVSTRGGQNLGRAVAIDGDTIVAGAAYDIAGGTARGAVYVFTKPAGGWQDATETAQLIPSDPEAMQFAGAGIGGGHGSLAISGRHVAVGAPSRGTGAEISRGAVYVFERPDDGWVNTTESAILTASDGDALDSLGASVGISGSTIVAGAKNARSPDNPDHWSGAVYVFAASGGTWSSGTESAKLVASDAQRVTSFGESVAVSGSTIAAGAIWSEEYGVCTGATYVFTSGPAGFTSGTESARVTTDDVSDCWAPVVALDGSRLLVRTSESWDSDSQRASSVVRLFRAGASGTWSDIRSFRSKTSDDDPGLSLFGLGTSLAVTPDGLAIGAPSAWVTYSDDTTRADGGVTLVADG